MEELVSVCVVTYNSENTIIETLDSVKNQSYQNIELIISDDNSSDMTVNVCEKWLDLNKNRFVASQIVTTSNNTGPSGNYNRAINVCNGDWIKPLDGDDVLFPNCISEFISYVNNHPDSKWVTCKAKYYIEKIDDNHFDLETTTKKYTESYKNQFKLPNDLLLEKMAYHHNIVSVAIIYNKEIIQNLGGYDEKYPMCEDFPFDMRALEAGYAIDYMDMFLVGYRRNSTSITSSSSKKLFNINYCKSEYKATSDICFKYFSSKEKVKRKYRYYLQTLMEKFGMNKNIAPFRIFYKIMLKISY